MISETEGFDTKPNKSLIYSYFVVAMLMIGYLLSLMDRVLLGMLAEPIREELNISDTQLGLLLGFGFVLFYSFLGIPLGAMADKSNRRNLIVIGVIVWSLATAATGLAGGFIALLIARMLVGAGEATLSPSALSTIGDRFEREHLGIAMSIFTLGGSIGIGAAMAFGGLLTQWSADLIIHLPFATLQGWRVAMLLVGLAGLPFAGLFFLLVREPVRRRASGPAQSASIREVFAYIAQRRRAFFGLFVGFGAMVVVSYIPMLWGPAHFSRLHGLSPAELALPFGLIFAIFSGAGLIVGGLLSDHLLRRGMNDAPIRILLCSLPFQAPFAFLAFTLTSTPLAFAALAALLFFSALFGGLQGVTVQLMTPSFTHGRMMAIYLLVITIIGMGFGPLIVGSLSEQVFHGAGGLGMAMGVTMLGALALCGAILLYTQKSIRRLVDERASTM